ncbi:hypothetical protein QAD02_005594 [Eretmocerus hayati]|uniref:Uncharacterized protein n=1 Tax=Eretmocerus hayati TaxID=131215 RepID=A0ACC2NT81_9HYME|nr:hypothetical protein QAD02_005594 [Eretmocerus hayati]
MGWPRARLNTSCLRRISTALFFFSLIGLVLALGLLAWSAQLEFGLVQHLDLALQSPSTTTVTSNQSFLAKVKRVFLASYAEAQLLPGLLVLAALVAFGPTHAIGLSLGPSVILYPEFSSLRRAHPRG